MRAGAFDETATTDPDRRWRRAKTLRLVARYADACNLMASDVDEVAHKLDVRLRRVIGSDYIASRPYWLLKPIGSDLGDVFDALRVGEVAQALSQYSGELLPQSASPVIARLRTELSASLRGAVLATGNLALLRRWLDLPEGRDDRHGWRVLHDRTQAGSVARAHAVGHLAGLDFDLA